MNKLKRITLVLALSGFMTAVYADQPVQMGNLNDSFSGEPTRFTLERRPSQEEIKIDEFQIEDSKKMNTSAHVKSDVQNAETQSPKGVLSKISSWFKNIWHWVVG